MRWCCKITARSDWGGAGGGEGVEAHHYTRQRVRDAPPAACARLQHVGGTGARSKQVASLRKHACANSCTCMPPPQRTLD